MATITVRNLSDDIHRRLRICAAARGISVEAAARELLDKGTRPPERLGDLIAERVKKLGVDFPEIERDREPLGPAKFE